MNRTRQARHDELKALLGLYGSQAKFARFITDEQQGEPAQPAPEQGETQEVATPENVDGNSETPSLATEADQRAPFHQDPQVQDYLQRQIAPVQQQNELLQQQLQQVIQMLPQQQQPQQPHDPWGLSEITADDALDGNLGNKLSSAFNKLAGTLQGAIAQNQLMSQASDMSEVIGNLDMAGRLMYGGQPSPLQRVIDADQGLGQSLSYIVQALGPQGRAHADRIAYALGRNDPEYRKRQMKNDPNQMQQVTQQAINTAQQINTIPSVSSVPGSSNMDRRAYMQQLADQQRSGDNSGVRTEIDKVLNG